MDVEERCCKHACVASAWRLLGVITSSQQRMMPATVAAMHVCTGRSCMPVPGISRHDSAGGMVAPEGPPCACAAKVRALHSTIAM
eukprot:354318-Chlamydomonas_euryale.AAC.4